MLRKLIVFFSILLLLFNNLLILTLLSGCSLIGYGIGSTLDSPSFTVSNVKYQMRDIEIGRNVTVYLRNGREKTGKFYGSTVAYPDSASQQPVINIVLQEDGQKSYINVNEVYEIDVSSSGSQKYIGLGIGAMFDLTIIILTAIFITNYKK